MSKPLNKDERDELKSKEYVLELNGLEIQCIKEALDLTVRTAGLNAAEVCLTTLISVNKAKPLIIEKPAKPDLKLLEEDTKE